MYRILRSYDERGHEKAVEIELEKLTDAQKFLHSKNALGGFDTIEETSEYLNAKTGWANTTMSAEAMNLEDYYETYCRLITEVDLSLYNKTVTDLSLKHKRELLEKFQTYWSEEDSSLIKKAEKLVSELNEFPFELKQSIYYNNYNQWILNTKKFSYLYQMNRRQ